MAITDFSRRVALTLCLLVLFAEACPPVTNCASCTNNLANCIGAGLRDIPKNFPRDLVTVDLSNNQLTEIREGDFQPLPSVQSVRLTGNGISVVYARAFSTMSNLMNLDLSGNPITHIDDQAFEGLGQIQTLSLMDMKLKDLGMPFKEIPTVSSLNLGYNQLTRIENDDFEKNEGIRVLDLSNNRIANIQSEAFKNLRSLRYLILKNNPLMEAKGLVFASPMLQLVDFSNCMLKEVPTKLPNAVADFRLGNNMIEVIKVTDFQNMTRLRLVTLNNNKLQKVEYKAFLTNENLKELWLSHNALTYVPRGLPANLMKLYMDYNDVFKLEGRLFDPEAKLELLSLEMNDLSTIAVNSLKDLKHLKFVNFQGNNLERIPSMTFFNLSNLDTLTLSNNPLKSIEAGAFNHLPMLTTLEMSYLQAKVADIGHDFLAGIKTADNIQIMNSPALAEKFLRLVMKRDAPEMPDVQLINLQYNNLETLPENMPRVFPNVKRVYLDGNPWKCDKRLAWLSKWMQDSSIEFYTVDPPACEKPLSLNGHEISSLKKSEFVEVSKEDKEDTKSVDAPKTRDQRGNSISKTQQGNVNKQQSDGNGNISNAVVPTKGSNVSKGTNKPVKQRKGKKGKGKKRKGGKRKKPRKPRKNRKGKRRNKKGKRRSKKDKRGKRRITGRVKRKCVPLADGKRKCCRVMKNGKERCRIRSRKVKKTQGTTPAPKLTNLMA